VLFPAAEISNLPAFTDEEYPALQGQVINLGGFFTVVSVRRYICCMMNLYLIFCVTSVIFNVTIAIICNTHQEEISHLMMDIVNLHSKDARDHDFFRSQLKPQLFLFP